MPSFIYKLAVHICLAAFILDFAVVFAFSLFTHTADASGCDSLLQILLSVNTQTPRSIYKTVTVMVICFCFFFVLRSSGPTAVSPE